MGSLVDFLSGTKILEVVDSPINGKITVVRSLAFGTYIQVANLTQSGGILYDVWKKSLIKVKNHKPEIMDCLIVGFGGGTLVGLIKKFWPKAEIVGVDIDPIMVDMGRKHLKFDEKNVKVHISDAFEFLDKKLTGKKFDLVLVDTYVGDEFPRKFETDEFIRLTRTVLVNGGIAVFNRLYYGEKRREAMKFGDKLEKFFKKVEIVFPEANVMFICS